jgi:hypothetical protein
MHQRLPQLAACMASAANGARWSRSGAGMARWSAWAGAALQEATVARGMGDSAVQVDDYSGHSQWHISGGRDEAGGTGAPGHLPRGPPPLPQIPQIHVLVCPHMETIIAGIGIAYCISILHSLHQIGKITYISCLNAQL